MPLKPPLSPSQTPSPTVLVGEIESNWVRGVAYATLSTPLKKNQKIKKYAPTIATLLEANGMFSDWWMHIRLPQVRSWSAIIRHERDVPARSFDIVSNRSLVAIG